MISKAATHAQRDAEQARLIRLLSEPEAAGHVEEDRVIVFARSGKVTLRTGSVPLRAADELESSGAIRRMVRSGRTDLFLLTSEGAARMRRSAGGAEDAFARQHRIMTVQATPDHPALAVNEAESPLLWLYRRQGRSGRSLIGDAEFAAGERLRADLTMARTLPRLTANWERTPTGGTGTGLTETEAILAARQRVDRAMAAVGPEFAGLLTDVCGFLKGMEAVERERNWPARSAKVVLVLALAALARHYGLSNAAVGQESRRKHRWGAADYRPAFTTSAQPASA